QSVPVLGFLSATVTLFMALAPGRLLGVKLASIFAIFTGQVWNLTFAFYHSLLTLPRDQIEATRAFRLSPWRRFVRLELPAVAEVVRWGEARMTAPGIGAYIPQAPARGDWPPFIARRQPPARPCQRAALAPRDSLAREGRRPRRVGRIVLGIAVMSGYVVAV